MDNASALFWLPRIEEGLLPSPTTVVIPYAHGVSLGVEDAPGPSFDAAFEEVDVILTPTTPSPAFALGEKSGDPVEMLMTASMAARIERLDAYVATNRGGRKPAGGRPGSNRPQDPRT